MGLVLKKKPNSGDRTLITYKGTTYNLRGNDIQVRRKDSARGPGALETIKGVTQDDIKMLIKNIPGLDKHFEEKGSDIKHEAKTETNKN